MTGAGVPPDVPAFSMGSEGGKEGKRTRRQVSLPSS